MPSIASSPRSEQDRKLDEMLAHELGWNWALTPTLKVWVRYSGEQAEIEEQRFEVPPYSSDRNWLPEILRELHARKLFDQFVVQILRFAAQNACNAIWVVNMMSMRSIVIAALKTLQCPLLSTLAVHTPQERIVALEHSLRCIQERAEVFANNDPHSPTKSARSACAWIAGECKGALATAAPVENDDATRLTEEEGNVL